MSYLKVGYSSTELLSSTPKPSFWVDTKVAKKDFYFLYEDNRTYCFPPTGKVSVCLPALILEL